MTNTDHPAVSGAETSVVVSLNDCPPGLFMFGETLGFKSEYVTTLENPRRYQCDAYVVESGEYFHGGAKNCAGRGALLVTPIDADRLTSPQAASADVREAWIPHTGGGCPVEATATVDTITRSGATATMRAGAVIWRYGSMIYEIMEPMPADAEVVFYRLAAVPAHAPSAGEVETLREGLSRILQTEIAPVDDPHAGAKNGKELIRAKAIARHLLAALATPDAAPIGSADAGEES